MAFRLNLNLIGVEGRARHSIDQFQRNVARPGFGQASAAAEVFEDGAEFVEVGDHGRAGGGQGVQAVPFIHDRLMICIRLATFAACSSSAKPKSSSHGSTV